MFWRRTMRRALFAFAALGSSVFFASAVSAQDLPAAQNGVRYSMTAVDGGVMRLDGASGRLSFCSKSADGYACKAVVDDRSAFMDEIEALAKQNADLKKQIADGGSALRLPKEEDLDKAFNMMERFVQRFGNEPMVAPKQNP
jgi:hypothetical protein